MRLNIQTVWKPFYHFPPPKKRNTTFTQCRENINVVNSLWDIERILEILMTMKPHKIIRDMKTNRVSWSADTQQSRKEQQLFGKKQEMFPAVVSMSRSGMDLMKDHTLIIPSGTTPSRSRECTETTWWDGHWMDCTFSESSVVKRCIKSYIPDDSSNETAEQHLQK